VAAALDGRPVAAEELGVAAREGRQVRAAHLFLPLDHEAQVHRQGPGDLAHGCLGHRLRHDVPLGVGDAAGEELAVRHRRRERLVAPLGQRVDGLDVVVWL
jgi:hypothetical protein